ncbi:hypothetical protein [Radiobacillus deserti]|uniref:DUF4030 domain-containing protein n=1 Tax=Radiobacillus deserti TaxID=2594883 RepID=A0A516KDI2_9BACI|nr:hypothetical protein [Radiobacillus deserti]QDP39461.1 hypothetical protein FN924_04280 [Radiobacillus deserti]
MKSNIKSEMNKIKIPNELDSYIESGVNSAYNVKKISKGKSFASISKLSRRKKSLYVIGATLVVLLLCINTLLHSKTVMVFASELPLTSSLFNLNPLSEQITSDLEKKDFYTKNMDISVSVFFNNEITIKVKENPEYFASIKNDLKNTVENFLNEENYELFQVKVEKGGGTYSLSNTQKLEKEKVHTEIVESLSKIKVKSNYIFVEPIDKYISVHIKNSMQKEKELLKYAQSIKSKLVRITDLNGYEIHVIASGPKESVNDDGSSFRPLTDLDAKIGKLARELTENEKYKVTGFSFKENPLTFKINTSVTTSDTEHGKYLKSLVREYLESSSTPPVLKSDSYQLFIYSANGKQIQ